MLTDTYLHTIIKKSNTPSLSCTLYNLNTFSPRISRLIYTKPPTHIRDKYHIITRKPKPKPKPKATNLLPRFTHYLVPSSPAQPSPAQIHYTANYPPSSPQIYFYIFHLISSHYTHHTTLTTLHSLHYTTTTVFTNKKKLLLV